MQIGKPRPSDNLPKDTLGRDGVEPLGQTVWLQSAALSSAVLPHIHGTLSKPKHGGEGGGELVLFILCWKMRIFPSASVLSIYSSLAVFIPLTPSSSNRVLVHKLHTAISHSHGGLWTSSGISGPTSDTWNWNPQLNKIPG